ncbi:hypothetical protein BGZ95_011946 [Linnemannia exigua]|uniref:Uncharacterized protein n=1 Tax=Linnemannia exigua TaxID=604196 RepID=A0AAD4D9S6_9FUNG|nr:hypothetical protein BGZ95_011946 [Linnemannia exigua]
MFNWIKSPTLPDTIETQAFRSISSADSPILKISTINDRTNRMKLIPWEDILEIFPDAIYLRDANGIVMPARDHNQTRISPKSIKLQPDVVLEVVSTHDIPPTSALPENIIKTEDLKQQPSTATTTTGITGGVTGGSGSTPRPSMTRGSTDIDPSHHTSSRSRSSSFRASSEIAPKASRKQSHDATPTAATARTNNGNNDDDDDDEDGWSPFQANSAATFSARAHALAGFTTTDAHILAGHHGTTTNDNTLLRQEMIHRLELLSAEQEERLNIILKACRARPPR